ncbi:hypothetical protein Goarm_020013 [Gossypium armourianum]|uniref:Uncharacterized protein n=1 Tax=Gossypium armourianum TaxID=34283 RepID=A0A7J9IN56_9ROSI|nr:hypothetical protein [Gossypium armourianum]
MAMAPANPLGSDPNDLPIALPSSYIAAGDDAKKDLDEFLGSIFPLSPPPSSLPLPKFSLKSKLSCNPEAAGTDCGATDNLRRHLYLRDDEQFFVDHPNAIQPPKKKSHGG